MENIEYETFYDIEHDGDVWHHKRLLEEDGYKILSTDYDRRARKVQFKVVKVREVKTTCGRFKVGDMVKSAKALARFPNGVRGRVCDFRHCDGHDEDLIVVDTIYGYIPFKEEDLDFCR